MAIFSPQDALTAAMVATACADGALNDREIRATVNAIKLLPVFEGYAAARFDEISTVVLALLEEDTGVEQLMGMLEEHLPDEMRETVYALTCDVAAADGTLTQEELALLELIADRMGVEQLSRAAIQRSARARWSRFS